MITVDATVQLILAISVSFAIVVVSYNLARLIGTAVTLLQELRRPLQNVSEITDLAVDDYKRIRGVLDFFTGLSSSLGSLKAITDLVKRFGSDKEEEQKESIGDK